MYNPRKETARLGANQRADRKNKQLHYNKNHLNFKAINRAAMAVLPRLIRQLLPGGNKIGNEWIALNPRRNDRHSGSFKVSLRSGRWADFATGDRGGDIISLLAYIANIRQGEAAQRIAVMLRLHHDA